MTNHTEQTAALIDRLRNEAQIHAQEARTANATIAEIYRIVTGGTGEPGNWHGAEPVRKCIEDLRAATLTLPAAASSSTEPVAAAKRLIEQYKLVTVSDHAFHDDILSVCNAVLAAEAVPPASCAEREVKGWSYTNTHGDVFYSRTDPAKWHPHAQAGFSNFTALVAAPHTEEPAGYLPHANAAAIIGINSALSRIRAGRPLADLVEPLQAALKALSATEEPAGGEAPSKIIASAEHCSAEVGRHDGKVVWVKFHSEASIEAFATRIVMLAALKSRTPLQAPAVPATEQADEDAAVIDKLARLLAGVAIALKGDELPLHRHSYHDLPELAAALKLEVDLYRSRAVPAGLSDALQGAANYIDVLGGDSKKYRGALAASSAPPASQDAADAQKGQR